MSQIWRGVSGGIEVLENVNEMADIPDISTINSEGVWYIESGEFGPDYIAPTNWDSSAGEFTDWFSLFDGLILVDIPDSVVSRPDDDDSISDSTERGLVFESDVNWLSIGARISNHTSNATRAYLHNVDTDTLIKDKDISDLSSGDSFTFEDVNISKSTEYAIYVDAEGSSFTGGYRSGESDYPYISDDENLKIVARWFDGRDGSSVTGVNDIGNTGFD